MKETLILYKDWWEAINGLPTNMQLEATIRFAPTPSASYGQMAGKLTMPKYPKISQIAITASITS